MPDGLIMKYSFPPSINLVIRLGCHRQFCRVLSRGDYDGGGAAAAAASESFRHFPFGKIKYILYLKKKIRPDSVETSVGTTPQRPTE